jgi:ribonucleoside-diphosphate reductase alpha chain
MQTLPGHIAELAATLPPLSVNATTVLQKRYLDRDEQGNPHETVDGLFWRVASTLAAVDAQYGNEDEQHVSAEEFFSMMRGSEFLPNSPTLANAGTRTGQLSACFVLPVADALSNGVNGIYDTLREAQLIFQTGGGVGYSFSRLRGKGKIVETTRGFSSGPVSFMDVYNTSCGSIAQGGIRRGAQMGILRVDHPDIMEFIRYKEDLTKLTNFNVSVAVTEEFLKALKNSEQYQLVDPNSGPTGEFLEAREVWNEIIQRAWSTGEPGLFFIDRANAEHPTPKLGAYEATNPCGEQPLAPYESCNLGSLTLDTFVENGKLDWKRLERAIHQAIHLMDNVVDANAYVPARGENPGVPKIREITLQTRKLGLGVMGLARMLFKLGLGYDTEEGRDVAARVYAFIDAHSKIASCNLAAKRGAFPYFQANKAEAETFFRNYWTKRVETARSAGWEDIAELYQQAIQLMEQHGVRNSTTTTVAPTGTLSILHDTSGGCEPEFALVISRWQADTEMFEANPVFAAELKSAGLTTEEIEATYRALGTSRGSLLEALAANKLDTLLNPALNVLKRLSATYIVAGDIAPRDHVLMQAALQKHCDSAISKTINFPNEATREEVEAAYWLAIESGCKGITVYRDGSRMFQPLTAGDKKAKKEEVMEEVVPAASAQPRPRPSTLVGLTKMQHTGDGKLYVTMNYDEEGLREVFPVVGRSGGTIFSLTEAIGRLISLALQYRVPAREIVHKLIGIRSANVFGIGPKQVLSIPDAIGKVMNESQSGALRAELPVPQEAFAVIGEASDTLSRLHALEQGESPECPNCGAPMKFGEGCRGGSCTNAECGYAKC